MLGITMNTPPATKPSLLKEVGALLLFLVVVGFFSLPSLSPQGEIAGQYKGIFLLLVFIRLAWSVCRRRFCLHDYFIYFGVVISFCIAVDFIKDLRW